MECSLGCVCEAAASSSRSPQQGRLVISSRLGRAKKPKLPDSPQEVAHSTNAVAWQHVCRSFSSIIFHQISFLSLLGL